MGLQTGTQPSKDQTDGPSIRGRCLTSVVEIDKRNSGGVAGSESEGRAPSPGNQADCEDLANVHDNSKLDDGRPVGSWASRYPRPAWVQITVELIYLSAILIACLLVVIDPALSKSDLSAQTGSYISYFGGLEIRSTALKWVSLGVSGLVGGTVFSLKWLYHSVAKGVWSRDRILWRFVVPLNSATVALFTGFLFASGAVPFLKDESLDSPLMAASFGFIFGYFSDSILAALQNFAQRIFGTLGREE